MTIAENNTVSAGSLRLERASPGFALVFDGYRGMETSIHFDYCEVHDDCVGLYIEGDELVSEIFTDVSFDTTAVAGALRAIQYNQIEADA